MHLHNDKQFFKLEDLNIHTFQALIKL